MQANIYTNIKQKDTNSTFVIVSRKPTLFGLRGKNYSNCGNDKDLESEEIEYKENIKFSERDLHPLLAKYLYDSEDFNLLSKTIKHESSVKNKKGQDRWQYSDMVGVYFAITDNFKDNTKRLVKNINLSKFKLYSFEIKIKLDFSNLKEAYFQAVSNSSWANKGYLVALHIEKEVKDEIKRLNQSFGIGLIELNTETLESKIIYESKTREELDIDTIDILIEKNPDFKNFIDVINNIIEKVDKKEELNRYKNDFDEVMNDDVLQKHIKDKNIS